MKSVGGTDMKIILMKVGRYLFPDIKLNGNPIIKLTFLYRVILFYGTYKI